MGFQCDFDGIFKDSAIQWLGGSDKGSVWAIHIPQKVFPLQWGAYRSYFEFPNYIGNRYFITNIRNIIIIIQDRLQTSLGQ